MPDLPMISSTVCFLISLATASACFCNDGTADTFCGSLPSQQQNCASCNNGFWHEAYLNGLPPLYECKPNQCTCCADAECNTSLYQWYSTPGCVGPPGCCGSGNEAHAVGCCEPPNILVIENGVKHCTAPLEVSGDPWLVGFNDQHYLFQGENNKWYSFLHDPPHTNANMRIVKPKMTKDDLETYINGFGLKLTSSDGEKHKVSLIVKEPENFEPKCEKEKGACIGEGAFEVKINGDEVLEPGFYLLDIDAWIGMFNSPWECKRSPHSHTHWDEFIQAKEEQSKRAHGRRLMSIDDRDVLLDKILDDKVFDSEVCKHWIEERKERGDLFDQKGTMSTIFFSSPSLSLRIEYIMNIDETWSNHHRFDVFFTHYSPSRRQTGVDKRSGVLGETAFLKYNEKGEPILRDRDLILSGKDEDYEVKGPFDTNFKAKKMFKKLR